MLYAVILYHRHFVSVLAGVVRVTALCHVEKALEAIELGHLERVKIDINHRLSKSFPWSGSNRSRIEVLASIIPHSSAIPSSQLKPLFFTGQPSRVIIPSSHSSVASLPSTTAAGRLTCIGLFPPM